jgi:hypothetical protein
MADVSFDSLADPDQDLRAAWRAQLAREGKLNKEGGTIHDLITGSPKAR